MYEATNVRVNIQRDSGRGIIQIDTSSLPRPPPPPLILLVC